MKTIIFLSLIFFVGCASFDDSVYESKKKCQELITRMAKNNETRVELYQKQGLNCIALMTNAKEQNRLAENYAKASVIMSVIGFVVVLIIASVN